MLNIQTDFALRYFSKFENVWFTSDTHFSHRNIITLSGRPFVTYSNEPDIDLHDETLIANFNSVIGKNDLLIHCGDVALGKIAESLPLVGLLNGHKVLIPGNHDRVFSGEKEKMRWRFRDEYLKVFNEVWAEQVTTYIPQLDADVALSHFPYVGDSQENDRHVDKRPVDYGLPLIHGHIHEKRHIDGRMFNVGVDVNGFMPVHHSVLRDWIETL